MSRSDSTNTHMLPAKNKLPRDTVKKLGGKLGASKIIAEPTTHSSVNGANNKPKGIVTHLGKSFGSISSYSSIPLNA